MTTKLLKILIVFVKLYLINRYFVDSKIIINITIGEVWPKPVFGEKIENVFFIDPNNFDFEVVEQTCDILIKALLRYKEIIKLSVNSLISDYQKDFDRSKLITQIVVNLTDSCEIYPQLNMDEWYLLDGPSQIIANSIWGILRALETYSQLVIPTYTGMLKIPDIRINDYPRFSHRGLMLDTARHYINIDTIMKILDGMTYNKLNAFHWHIVDDESFPYQSAIFPELSEKGAFSPSLIYTRENISNIIEYARLRGIRVIPEFDMPAHTRSWGLSHPELISECDGDKQSKKYGQMDPTNETTYAFLTDLFSEVFSIFYDKYVHVGGNEMNCHCWERNTKILKYMTSNNLTCEYLQRVYFERVTRLVTQKSFSLISWQEAVDEHLNMPIETIAQIRSADWRDLLKNFTSRGREVILSSCWMQLALKDSNWQNDYNCDPYDFPDYEKGTTLIIGGEACIWTNYIGNSNILPTIFPRISAMAERLWSPNNIRNISDAVLRLEEHTCRMILRGIPAQPLSDSGIC